MAVVEASPPDAASPAARIAATPGVQRVPTCELELFIVRRFLDAATCAALICRIDERRRPSEIADDVGIANFRTSETCDLDWRDPIVGEVDRKIAGLLGIPLAASEPIQGQRYTAGQERSEERRVGKEWRARWSTVRRRRTE